MGTVDMKLKKSTMAIVGLLVLGAIAVAAVAMGDRKTARRRVGTNGHGYAPGPGIVSKLDSAQCNLQTLDAGVNVDPYSASSCKPSPVGGFDIHEGHMGI
jgi:hypothetical protein